MLLPGLGPEPSVPAANVSPPGKVTYVVDESMVAFPPEYFTDRKGLQYIATLYPK